MNATEVILVKELAGMAGIHSRSVTRDLQRQGYDIVKRRTSKGGPPANALARVDADRYLAERHAGMVVVKPVVPEQTFGIGVVYVVEAGPGRIKLGWTTNLSERLATYRTLIPDARVLRLWRTETQAVETVALMIATRHGVQIRGEVFEDSDKVLVALDEQFERLGIENAVLTGIEGSDVQIGNANVNAIGVTINET